MYHPLHVIGIIISFVFVSKTTKTLLQFAKIFSKFQLLTDNMHRFHVFPTDKLETKMLSKFDVGSYSQRVFLHCDFVLEDNKIDYILFQAACDEITQSLSYSQEGFRSQLTIDVNVATSTFFGLDAFMVDSPDGFQELHHTDIIAHLTSESNSLWNIANSNCEVYADCVELYFTVYAPNSSRALSAHTKQGYANIANTLNSVDGFAILDRRASFVVMNAEAPLGSELDRITRLQKSHLKYLMTPEYSHSSSGLVDRLYRYNDAFRALLEIHSIHIVYNAMLLVDVWMGESWLRRYLRAVDDMLSLNEMMICSVTEESHWSSVKEHCAEGNDDGDLDSKYLREKVSEVHIEILRLLHSSADPSDPAGLPLLTRSAWPLEQYFALLAPYWLPLLVPLIKAVRVSGL